jgi:hypothetical protein
MKNKILVPFFLALVVFVAYYVDANNQRLAAVERANMRNNLRIFQLQKIIIRRDSSPSAKTLFPNYQNRGHEKAI